MEKQVQEKHGKALDKATGILASKMKIRGGPGPSLEVQSFPGILVKIVFL